jgi:hypothetical protein
VSVKKLFLSLAALGLLAASVHVSQPGQNVPSIGDRDLGGNCGTGHGG